MCENGIIELMRQRGCNLLNKNSAIAANPQRRSYFKRWRERNGQGQVDENGLSTSYMAVYSRQRRARLKQQRTTEAQAPAPAPAPAPGYLQRYNGKSGNANNSTQRNIEPMYGHAECTPCDRHTEALASEMEPFLSIRWPFRPV